jgi:hypothetical protein
VASLEARVAELEQWQRDAMGQLRELTLTAMILSRDHREQLVTDRDTPPPAPAFPPPADPMEAHLRWLQNEEREVMIRLARLSGRDAVAGIVYGIGDGLAIVQERHYGGTTGHRLQRWTFRIADVVSVEEV